MRLPLSWLREFLPELPGTEELAQRLTSLGIEVDAVESVEAEFTGVVVAEVLHVNPHPQSQKLVVAQITDGKEQATVVCGASNCRVGLRTAWARPGAILPSAEGKIAIQPATLRGVESAGMLCSSEELGLPCLLDGIWEIGHDCELGAPLHELWRDTVFHLSLTPNLGHALSVLGIAREISASFGIPLHDPVLALPSLDSLPLSRSVELEAPAECPQYHLLSCEGHWPAASPLLWQMRLLLAGLRPRLPVVDVTNLVMLERGQPLHSFDADRVQGSLTVRTGRPQEVCTLLDGQEHSLERVLVIADQKEPLAAAGVMGGASSAVHPGTWNILVESALFEPGAVRRSSKQLAVRSESSYRFERGVDPSGPLLALRRTLQLLGQIGGKASGLTSLGQPPSPLVIEVETSWLLSRLGMALSQSEMEELLRRERCTVRSQSSRLYVSPPLDRNDLREPIDLVEEIARLYGYDHLRRGTPSLRLGALTPDPVYSGVESMRDALVAQGLQEFLTPALLSPVEAAWTAHSISSSQQVRVQNPASEEHSVLRLSLIPGLLKVLHNNQAHREKSLAGFEIGRIHYRAASGEGSRDLWEEPWMAGVVVEGPLSAPSWSSSAEEWDFFRLKGLLAAWAESLGLPDLWTLQKSDWHLLHPHRQALLLWDQQPIGICGELHPRASQEWDLRGRPLVAEWRLEPFVTALRKNPAPLRAPAAFPGTERDCTFALPTRLAVATLEQAITAHRPSILQSWCLTTVFPDPQNSELHHVTWRFEYRDPHRTLTGAEVDSAQATLVEKLTSALASVQE